MAEENETTDQVESPESVEPTLEDLQSQLEVSKASNKKLENDLRSERGQRTRDQGFNELAEDVSGMKAQLTAIANRTASGETESLPADFAEIDQKKAETIAVRNWENNYEEAEQNLGEAMIDDKGDVVLDEETVKRLSDLWKEAQRKQDLHGLYRVVAQAGKEARLVEKQKTKADATKVEEDAKVAKKVSDTKNGVHDVSVAPPSGISGGKSIAQINSATNVKDISDEDYAKLVASG